MKKQTHRYREQTCGCHGGGGRGGTEWEFGISRGKLLYIGWINNKVLLHSSENYIQYPVTNHSGKEYEKEYMSLVPNLFGTRDQFRGSQFSQGWGGAWGGWFQDDSSALHLLCTLFLLLLHCNI